MTRTILGVATITILRHGDVLSDEGKVSTISVLLVS